MCPGAAGAGWRRGSGPFTERWRRSFRARSGGSDRAACLPRVNRERRPPSVFLRRCVPQWDSHNAGRAAVPAFGTSPGMRLSAEHQPPHADHDRKLWNGSGRPARRAAVAGRRHSRAPGRGTDGPGPLPPTTSGGTALAGGASRSFLENGARGQPNGRRCQLRTFPAPPGGLAGEPPALLPPAAAHRQHREARRWRPAGEVPLTVFGGAPTIRAR